MLPKNVISVVIVFALAIKEMHNFIGSSALKMRWRFRWRKRQQRRLENDTVNQAEVDVEAEKARG